MNLHRTIKLISGFVVFIAVFALAMLIPNGMAIAEFTGCRDSGEPTMNASIVIMAGAIGPHNLDPNIDPAYTPIAGDEIAVFNTNGDCAGKITHDPDNNTGLTAWGGAGGMAADETMEFRIWDSANDRFFTLNVTNITPDDTYQQGQLYFMNAGTPTAVSLANIGVNTAVPTGLLLILLVVVGTAVGLLTSRRRSTT